MNAKQVFVSLGVAGGLLWMVCGCAGPDVNPASARTGRGYVDLYSQPKAEVWWKVDVFDKRSEVYREFTAQFHSAGADIFRIEARPGSYKARISVVNGAVEKPAEVEVEVREGMITPIRVTGEVAGESSFQVKEDRLRWEASRVREYPQRVWRISASAQPPVPYAPKEDMKYWD